jgi:2,3-bisphosphoglycerate-independent phosphoglycerate mutase
LIADITDNDPHHENVPMAEIKSTSIDGEKTARIMRSFISQSHKVLREHPLNKKRVHEGKHPANMVLFRGGGVTPYLESFESKYDLSSAVIAAAGLIIGIGRMLGMSHIPVEGVTGGVDSNIENKIKSMLKAFDRYDFVLLNIKGADEAGHDGDFQRKTSFISRVDESLAPLLELEDTLIVVTGDHSTPVCVGDHSGDPVPILIVGGGIRTDDVGTYDEFSAARGGLGRIRGLDLMPILMDLINKAEIFGA